MRAALPAVTPTSVGAAGAVAAGTTAAEGGDGGLVPTMFVAVTVHVYVLPLVRFGDVSGDVVPDFDRGSPCGRGARRGVAGDRVAVVDGRGERDRDPLVADRRRSEPPGRRERGAGTAPRPMPATSGPVPDDVGGRRPCTCRLAPLVSTVTVSGEPGPDVEPVTPPLLEVHVAV